MAAGANGAILVSANLIADIWQEIYQLIKRGDLAAAQNLQAKIKKLIRIVVRSGPTQAVKEGLQMMGLKMSNSRLPDVLSGMRLKLKSRARRHRRNVKSCTGKTIQD